MTRLKFRQLDKITGEWNYWEIKDNLETNSPSMQSTGLFDRNGKEIYEGDIVKLEGWEPKNYEVVFDRGGFCLKWGDDANFYNDIKYAEDERSEIIGNIHESPDLLTIKE